MPEEPVVVSGGSVTVQIPGSFTGQTDVSGQQYFKNDTAKLVRIVVNGQDVLTLSSTDRVEIICET
jgi:hypothetical protein